MTPNLRAAVFLLFVGCGHGLPTTPSVALVSVTVQTRVYLSEAPLSAVSVWVNDAPAGQTDADGRVVLTEPVGQSVTVRVSRPGYLTLLPWAMSEVGPGPETWTFWLEPTP